MTEKYRQNIKRVFPVPTERVWLRVIMVLSLSFLSDLPQDVLAYEVVEVVQGGHIRGQVRWGATVFQAEKH